MIKKCKFFFILIVVSLIPLLWFKNGLLIAGGDQSLYLNPGFYLDKLFLWSGYLNGGGPVSNINILFPFLALFKLTHYLGVSTQLFQKLWFIFSFLLALVSIRFLFNTVSLRRDSIGTLVAMCFYVFNLYALIITPFEFQYWIIYAAFPLTLALYIRGLDNRKYANRYLALGGLSSLLYSATNPPLFLVSFIPLILYLIIYLISNRGKEFRYRLIFSFKFFVIIILLNLWAFYPTFYSLLAYAKAQTASGGKMGLGYITYTQIYEAIRLMGAWWWRFSHHYKYYNNTLFISLSYVAPFLVLSILLFDFKKTKISNFILLAIVGIFLSKGTNPPFGFLYKYAYLKVPGFTALREPFNKFTFITAISYAVIIGFLIDKIWAILFLNKWYKNTLHKYLGQGLFSTMVFGLILINVWPTFTNDLIRPQDKKRKSFHVKVPDYWRQAGRWLSSSNEHFSLLELPKDNGYGTYFNWESGYDGINPSIYLLNVPLWGHGAFSNSYSDRLVDLVYDGLYDQRSDRLSILLGMMNVKYVHLRDDIDWKTADLTSPEFNRKAIDFQKGLKFERKFGQKEFYTNEQFLPLIYAAHHLKVVAGFPRDHEHLEFLEDLERNDLPALIFRAQVNSKLLNKFEDYHEKDDPKNSSRPTINFKRINPTKYLANVISKKPFCLVFGQAYHPAWVSYIDGERVTNHFVINGFANGYLIDKTGNFKIMLEFIPQRIESLLILVAIIATVLILIKATQEEIKRRNVQALKD